jgi:hypothetical protein
VPKWTALFNGKDLTGWKSNHPDWKQAWQVEKGVLVGLSTKWVVQWTERDDYADFHLRIETRIGDGAYAQLLVRDTVRETDSSHDGYRVVLNSTNGNPNKTGGLVAGQGRPVVTVTKSPVPPDKWFLLEVIAKGDKIIVKVDGQTTADYQDADKRFSRGHIALAISGDQKRVDFRKIEIKEGR